MLIELYYTEEDENVLNKKLEFKGSVELTLRRDFEIKNPTLIISKIPTGVIHASNYVKIPQLKRSYFISNVTTSNGKMYTIDLVSDLLETYKTEILRCDALLNRKAKTGDLLVSKIDASSDVEIEKVPSNKGLGGESTMLITTIGSGK